MPAIQIRWSTLFKLTELDFIPDPPSVLKVSDELIQAISWLTGATGHDRRLLRCTDDGALLVADAWSNYTAGATVYLDPESGSTAIIEGVCDCVGVLVSTGSQIIKATFVKEFNGSGEDIYIPADYAYWYPHAVYSVEVAVVPDPNGTASNVGVTTFK